MFERILNYAKFSEKLTFFTPLIRTRMFSYQGGGARQEMLVFRKILRNLGSFQTSTMNFWRTYLANDPTRFIYFIYLFTLFTVDYNSSNMH